MGVGVAVGVAVAEQPHMSGRLCNVREELGEDDFGRIEAHQQAADEQQAADPEGAQGLDLAVAQREACGRRLVRPGDGPQRHKVRHQVCEGVVGVCYQRLRVEDVASDALADGHGQVGEQADSGDADAGILLVLRGQVCSIVVMVMMTMTVAMTMPVGSGLAAHREGRM